MLDATDNRATPRPADLDGPSRPSLSRTPFSKAFIPATSYNKHTEAGFKECYRLGAVLGCGAFSTVRLAVDRATGEQWACKVVTEKAERALLLREVEILQQLDHPNLLKYREHFSTSKRLYIITELLQGSDLLTAVLERGSYSEDDARAIAQQMLSALAYLDSRGIAHRDLKMENIVLPTKVDSTRVKIIDFGLADQLSSSKSVFHGACGTPLYLAPEVASRLPYGTSCDVWAAGVVLFMLLSGDYPFRGNSVRELVTTICEAKLVRFKDPIWEITSPGAKSFVQTLLTADPTFRVTAKEALEATWLAQ